MTRRAKLAISVPTEVSASDLCTLLDFSWKKQRSSRSSDRGLGESLPANEVRAAMTAAIAVIRTYVLGIPTKLVAGLGPALPPLLRERLLSIATREMSAGVDEHFRGTVSLIERQ